MEKIADPCPHSGVHHPVYLGAWTYPLILLESVIIFKFLCIHWWICNIEVRVCLGTIL